MQEANWPAKNRGSMDYLMQAKADKIIRAHGTSCHGMDPLSTSAKSPFVEVDLARINPEGIIMDRSEEPDEVASRLEEMHNAGKGVIGMKIFGEGQMKEAEPPRRLAPLRARPRHSQRLHHRLRVNRPDRRRPRGDGSGNCVAGEEVMGFVGKPGISARGYRVSALQSLRRSPSSPCHDAFPATPKCRFRARRS